MRMTARILASALYALTLLVIGGTVADGVVFYEDRMFDLFLVLVLLTALITFVWGLIVPTRRPQAERPHRS
jgi:hypothetical protein